MVISQGGDSFTSTCSIWKIPVEPVRSEGLNIVVRRDRAVTKAELIERISLQTGLSKPAAGRVLAAALEAITAEMKKGHKIILLDFGTFFLSKRMARVGRNPKTGKMIKIPAARVPKFTAVKGLKEAVN